MTGISNTMRKSVFIVLLLFFAGCKEEVIQKPEHLIEKGVMVDIMYDLSLLNAMKYQSQSQLEGYDTNELEYIYKKYKIDSAQFIQNNNYYTSNYKEYKKMFDQVTERINNERIKLDTIINREENKKNLSLKEKRVSDSLKRKKSLKERLEEGAKTKDEGVLD
ncbi:DUF4296 domain-containing protein [Flavobacterium sp. NG2]|uniref:DUF4296 domain-containing protein n=1 Tax=Flavobacterium sp. NG2 TaxID=3097547 RepID=UPI002A82116B|nr:DUF4296 domain-containing protein [Flavobacterium sp. NG2]WPR72467.1 DUF4296 domain-containing protein [Flavobacterium sp. NG2]